MACVTAGAAQPPVLQRQQRMFLHASEHATLDPRNVLALHTLFAIAHSLALLLGESWLLVLGTVTCLDRILSTPRQAAQVSCCCCQHAVRLSKWYSHQGVMQPFDNFIVCIFSQHSQQSTPAAADDLVVVDAAQV
jgi:hypothetical protein